MASAGGRPPGARSKTSLQIAGEDRGAALERLERAVLQNLCNCGGSLSLTALKDALKDALVDDGILTPGPEALRTFLASGSPHSTALFRLDEDPRRQECIVKAKTDAGLCQSYKPHHDRCSEGPNCESFHLCSHFISDRCKRGKKCKWPHDLRSRHNEEVLIQNGLACLDNDDVLLVLRQSWIDITVPDICRHYNTRKGCNKDKCQFLHICEHYIRGDCKFTTANKQGCFFTHDIKDQQPLRVWKKYHIDAAAKSPGELLALLREKKRQANQSSEEDGDDSDEDEEEEVEAVSRQSKAERGPTICTHYNGKGCSKGDKCTFLHVCSFFVHGKCKFQNTCRRVHDFQNCQAQTVWAAHGIDADSKSEGELIAILLDKMPQGGGDERARRGSGRKQSESGSADNLVKNEICEYNLRGKCHFGDECRKVHCDHPFQWQRSKDKGQTWTNPHAGNTYIEKAFCDVRNASVNLKSIDGRECLLDFKTMTWKLGTGSESLSRDLRRLETPSTKTSEDWKNVMCTSWQWHFLDNGKIWVTYAQNAKIEEAYQKYLSTRQDSEFEFETEQFHYVLDFASMQQRNKRLGTQREVRRRPCKLVTKDVLERSLQTLQVLSVILPRNWDARAPDDPLNNFVLCRLDKELHQAEYDAVSQSFDEKMDASDIVKIERIQNKELWQDFILKRDRMRKQQANDPKELLLFHGTQAHVVKAICQQNFDFRISGSRVGCKWGKGSYFSKSAKYSDCYATPDAKNRRYMFLVRVLVGAYAQGDPSFARPPLMDDDKLDGPLFDSCVDNPMDPLIYVIFDRVQVYPEHLITYKKK